jgi:TPR repeat protein
MTATNATNVSIAVTVVSMLLTLLLEGPRLAERLRALSSAAAEVRRKRASRARTILLIPRPVSPEPPTDHALLPPYQFPGLSRILKTLTAMLSGGLIIPWTLFLTWFTARMIAGVKSDAPPSAAFGLIIVLSAVFGLVWGVVWLRLKSWAYIVYLWLLGAGAFGFAIVSFVLYLSLNGSSAAPPTPVSARGTMPIPSFIPRPSPVALAAVPASSPIQQPVPEMSPSPSAPTPAIGAPDAGVCGAFSGPPVPNKPCGSDVAQCATDIDSCRARAQRLDGEAAAQLGYLYMHGIGLELNYTLAKNWSWIAATKGNPLGQDTMGELYKLGEGGVPQDYQQTQALFAKAAAQDCALAENELGDLYLSGTGVERNRKEAFKWYKQAADRDDAMGQNNLGYMYIRGFGVNKDLGSAKDWYLKSAKQGNPLAQDALGSMYQFGWGVEKDPVRAFQCYKTAAKQGWATAQIHLAELYESGVGGDQDSTEAAKWYCKAAGMGNDAAKRQVHSMGADCSSLPVAGAQSSPAAGAVSSPAPSALSTRAISAESR